VRLAHKIEKLGNAEAFESARRHFRRSLLARRLGGLRCNPERLIKTIDGDRFEAIRQRHAVDNPGNAWPKYLNLSKWISKNLRRVRDLELDFGRRKRILDIGCGAGYFLHICNWLGHDVVGLDIDDVPMYREMTQLLGLDRIVWRVEPFKRLPRLAIKFDLITAFMICFNGHKGPNLWATNQWRFFLVLLHTHVYTCGCICLVFDRDTHSLFSIYYSLRDDLNKRA
jgi:SAM-dependent methyltransferase